MTSIGDGGGGTGNATKQVPMSLSPDLTFTQPTEPAWEGARAVVLLVLAIPMIVCYSIALVLLLRRRNHYPLPGRGAWILIIWNLTSFIGTCINTASALTFTQGSPCGVSMVLVWIFSPFVFGFIFSGSTMLFRIAIRSYLAELEWRQALRRFFLAHSDASLPDFLLQEQAECLIPGPLLGTWYIHRRRWIHPRRIGAIICGLAMCLLLVLIVLGVIRDVDIAYVNQMRRDMGIAELPFSSTFESDAFFYAPTCLPLMQCKKCWIYPVFMVPFLGFVAFVGIQVNRHGRAMESRVTKQARFAAWQQQHRQYLHQQVDLLSVDRGPGSDVSRVSTIDYQQGFNDVPRLEPTPTPAPATMRPRMELDELRSVYGELRMGLCVAVTGQLSAIVLGMMVPAWATLSGNLTLFSLFWVFCVGALRQSYEVSRQQRQIVVSPVGQAGGKCRIATVAVGVSTSATFVVPQEMGQHPEHTQRRISTTGQDHLPVSSYFHSLRHVLHDEVAFSVLLRFLRKEFSSENALFYIETKRFTFFCQEFEMRLQPDWNIPDSSGTPTPSEAQMAEVRKKDANLFDQLRREPTFGSASLPDPLPLPPTDMSISTALQYIRHAAAWALQVRVEFLHPDSIYQVNLSGPVMQLITARCRVLDAWMTNLADASVLHPLPPPFPLSTLYFEATAEILQLMDRDTFRRFVITKEFAQMVHDHEQKNQRRGRGGRRQCEKEQQLQPHHAIIVIAEDEADTGLEDSGLRMPHDPGVTRWEETVEPKHVTLPGMVR